MSIPLVSSHFFENHPPSVDLFQKWKDLYPWNESILPIYEWEGILYIGDARKLNSESEFQEKKNPLTDDNIEEYQRQTLNSLQTEHILIEASCDDLKKIWESWGSIELKIEAPEGLDINISPPQFSFKEQHPAISTHNEVPTEPIVSAQTIQTPPPLPSAETAADSSQKPASFETFIESIINKLNPHFRRSMFFIAEETKIYPWKWNEAFDSSSKNNNISLQQPSPFRVISRTLKPYHGTIPENNKVIEKFTESWMRSTTLKSGTFFPILNDGILVGILLATNNNDTVTQDEFEYTRKIAKEIEKTVMQELSSSKTSTEAA